MKYAIYQMDIIPGDPTANQLKVKEWVASLIEGNKPDTIVLPELWTTGYTLEILKEIADEDGVGTKEYLSSLAKEFGINIIGGSVATKINDYIYNTSFVFDRKGDLVYTYNKVHLVPMLNEHKYITGGTDVPEVFELDGIKMGLIICYDLRFPEIIRPLAIEGAQVLHVVAEWPSARTLHWTSLQIARAIENQMYVISSNRIGNDDDVNYCGTSLIINPSGEVLMEGSTDKEETLSLKLDFDQVNKSRKNIPIFSSRMPHLYKKHI